MLSEEVCLDLYFHIFDGPLELIKSDVTSSTVPCCIDLHLCLQITIVIKKKKRNVYQRIITN